MDTMVRAGLVGCGSLSQRGILPHLSLDDARARVRLVAVADSIADRARLTADQYSIPAHFTDLGAMIAAVDLDLVLVITPIQRHFEDARTAIQAGKHVYIQKAMTTTLAESDELLALAAVRQVKLAAAPGFELFPTTGQMRDLVQGGALGRLCVGFTYTLGFGHEFEPIRNGQGPLKAIDPTWYYRPGAGPLPDVTVYALQLATSVLGPVRRVTALSNKTQPERSWQGQTVTVQVDDNNLVLMEFVSGALVTAVGASCRGSGRIPWGGLGLYGTAGVLEITEVDHSSGYPVQFEVQGEQSGHYSTSLSAQRYLSGDHLSIEEPHVYVDIMDLVDAIIEDRAPRAGGAQARHVVEIIEKAHIAAHTGQTQTLSSNF